MGLTPSPMEIAVIAIIALIVLGPNKLPEAARSLGKGLREMRDSFSGEGRDDDDLALDDYDEDDEDDDSGVEDEAAAEDDVELAKPQAATPDATDAEKAPAGEQA